jgi:flagellar biosynthetic protein FlhB
MSEGNKTEKPTARRRQKAREKGQVVRSRDLSSTLALAGVLAVLTWGAMGWLRAWRALFRSLVNASIARELNLSSPVLEITGHTVLASVAPVLGAAWLLAAAGGLAQGGLVLAPAALTPSFDRLNPANRLKQIFSISGLAALLKSLLPFAAIAYCAVLVVARDWRLLGAAAAMNIRGLVAFVTGRALEIGWRAVLILLLWSGLDYLISWHKLESDLSMSREEIKEEMKESEGNPTSKMRIRRLQRQAHRRRMVQDVSKAAVVVTNPTHFAVALAYDPAMVAPTVVAKGQNLLAAQIREAARWHGIPIMENPPLAQALYRTTEVGSAIPAKLYLAVAELLAFVYRAQQRAAGKGGA